jgi:HD-like signal output (HDOD) protein
MNNDLEEKINVYIRAMPSLPTSVVKVIELCNDPRSSPADLNYVISLDPVLTGRVLKLINSAYYGQDQRVTSLVRAIIMLGLNTVKNLALSTAVVENLGKRAGPRGVDMEAFWRHSLGVGVAARILAKKRQVDPERLEEYFTAGLLHDIGKIPLNSVHPRAYATALRSGKLRHIPLIRAEDSLLGINHCVCGGLIVEAWKLRGPVGDAIMYHHDSPGYQGPHQEILHHVALANYLVQRMDIGFAGDSYPEIDPAVWDALDLQPDIEATLAPEVNEAIERAQIFLKL